MYSIRMDEISITEEKTVVLGFGRSVLDARVRALPCMH